jgi:hypothetical protein
LFARRLEGGASEGRQRGHDPGPVLGQALGRQVPGARGVGPVAQGPPRAGGAPAGLQVAGQGARPLGLLGQLGQRRGAGGLQQAVAAPGSALAAPATSEACSRESSPARAAAPRPGCSPMARPASMPRRASPSEVPEARASCSATWARGAERPAMPAAVSEEMADASLSIVPASLSTPASWPKGTRAGS